MIRKNILSLVLFFAIGSIYAQVEEVSLNNLSINSDKMEFGAIPHGDGLLFTSTNLEQFKGKIDKCNTEDYFAKMVYAGPEEVVGLKTETGFPVEDAAGVSGETGCGFTTPTLVSGELDGKYHDGTPTISPDGNKMIFARNYPGESNFMNACNDGKLHFRLMSADMVDGQWINVQELPLGDPSYNTAHPTFSPDGQCLYFSSDRPGGSGGMDLYKSCMEGESWSTPMNLGVPINSEGHEVFPYAANNGDLYYSSNGLGGSGGLDVVSSSMTDGTWSTPTNLGEPFNSPGDDLGFTLLPDGESGYLTSNRAGGKGGDDLYCWKINEAPVTLAVEDAASKARIGNALVKIKELEQSRDYTTNAEGMTTPDIMYRRCYELEVDHPGYEYWSKEVCAKELASKDPYIVPLVKKTCPLAANVIWENKSIAADAKVTVRNITTGESEELTANGEGGVSMLINCVNDFEFIASKNDKTSEKVSLTASDASCNCDENKPVTLILPKPPPPPPPVCACTGNPNEAFNIPVDQSPKIIRMLGSRPQFGNSSKLTSAEFLAKLQQEYNSSARDAAYLDGVFQGMGYAGFADADVSIFTETILPTDLIGNMGYTSQHKIKYTQLSTSGADLEAFRIKAANGCHVHFMKTCGNFFFFCTK